MELLNPWMIGLAATAAVPVVLHLIMRQTPRQVVFPALRFVRQRRESNRRRLRLRHLLLLLLRAGALCLLALALARPSLFFSGMAARQQAPVSAVMIFDTSPRMNYEHASQSRLEVARELGQWLIDELPDESQVAVIDSSAGGAQFQIDLGKANERIERLRVTNIPEPFLTVLADSLRLLKTGQHDAKDVYVFTDLARTAWVSDTSQSLQPLLDDLGEVGVQIIDVGAKDPENTYLGDVRMPSEVFPRNSEVLLRTDVARLGSEIEKTVRLEVLGPDGQMQNRDQATVTLASGDAQELEFVLSGLEPGVHQGRLRILGPDGLRVDDQRWFTVEVTGAWPVLLAAPPNPEYYAFDLHEALSPEAVRLERREKFRCTVVSQDDLARQPLDRFKVVCLLDPAPLSPTVWNQLHEYVVSGGSLAVFLGRNAEKSVSSFNNQAAQLLLAGTLADVGKSEDGVYLAPEDYQHPMLAAFRPVKDTVPWQRFPVFRYWQLGEEHAGVRVVIPYSNGRPALLERLVEGGKTLTMTTPISDELDNDAWNVIPTGLEPWPFFVLSNEMAQYLVSGEEHQLNYTASPGLVVKLRLPGREGVSAFRLTEPSGKQAIRKASPDELTLGISSLEEIGNYRINAGGEGGLDLGFSVNLSPEQSQLERADEQDVKAVFGEQPLNIARGQEEITLEERRRREGRELFPYLILIIAVALAAEHLLANRFYGMRDSGGGQQSEAESREPDKGEPETPVAG